LSIYKWHSEEDVHEDAVREKEHEEQEPGLGPEVWEWAWDAQWEWEWVWDALLLKDTANPLPLPERWANPPRKRWGWPLIKQLLIN
jgi:hypothetical protein